MSKSSEKNRVGATSTDSSQHSAKNGLLGKEVGPDQDMLDLFLTDENLIRLAIGHLAGKRPPRKQSFTGRFEVSPELKKQTFENMVSQPARIRKILASKLQRELAARSWTAQELAEHSNLGAADCRALLNGTGFFTKEIAAKLASCLATSELYWLSEWQD